ncbi:MAG TPA: GAF domain-containing protein, partial [Anaerolineales bacterium]|nr:GAF domain-containing protein [Anaerolineales bacterium]
SRLALRTPLTEMIAARPSSTAYTTNRDLVRQALRGMLTEGAEIRFSDAMLVHFPDGVVLASSDPRLEGQTLPAVQSGIISTTAIETRRVFDDALLDTQNLAFVTSTPLLFPVEPGVLLIGVNRGRRAAELLQLLQTPWEDRSPYGIGVGEAYLAIEPDSFVHVDRNSTAPLVAEAEKVVFELAARSPTGSFRAEEEGVDELGVYEWLSDWDMGVVIVLPQAAVFAELNSFAPFMVALVVISVLVSMLIVAFATGRMLRPLETLTDFSERISRGEWQHRVPEARGDELGTLAAALNRMAEELSGLYRSLEARVEERTRQVRTAAEVARAVTSTPQLEDLLRRAVELIRERFSFYHVSIFLLDNEGKNAVLRESTGQVGAVLKARHHSLPVGSQSIIGWVTANNQPRIASDVGRDPVHLSNELLPETRSEAAVPLQVAGRVLGALDVQSTEPGAFTPEMLEVLQTLADQLSAAIQNARLAQESAQAAERARVVSTVTSQITGVLEIEQVLQTAAEALHRTLGQPEVVIRLLPPTGPEAPAPDDGNGKET